MPGILRLLLLGILFPRVASAGDENRISAYYYPWYGSDGTHWREGYQGKEEGNGPLLGEYDSRSVELIQKHLAMSREFGINTWICSWWGPGSREDETLREHVLPEWEKSPAGGIPLNFCLLYEAQGLLGLDPETGIPFDSPSVNLFAGHFRWIADHYFSHPSYQHINGRPVVYLYLSRTFSGEYARALAAARAVCAARGFDVYLVGDEVYWGDPDPDRLRLLDAVTAYNMHGPRDFAGLEDLTPFIESCDAVYSRWREAAAAVGVGFIPNTMPGFDSSGVAPGAHYVIPRRLRPGAGSLSTFKAMSEMAQRYLDPALREITITSFNEWHEGTQIEPSTSGDDGVGEILRLLSGRQ